MANTGGACWSHRVPAEEGKRMSRLYEVMFIVRPDVADEDVDKLIAGFTTSVTNGGGVVKNLSLIHI